MCSSVCLYYHIINVPTSRYYNIDHCVDISAIYLFKDKSDLHLITPEGILPLLNKVSAIRNYLTPTTIKELDSNVLKSFTRLHYASIPRKLMLTTEASDTAMGIVVESV